MTIHRPGQLWGSGITYTDLGKCFAYLIAIIDWHSRKLFSWRLTDTIDTDFRFEAFEEAFKRSGPAEILNTEPGSQFRATRFITALS